MNKLDKILEDHYRLLEGNLTDFKNKKLGYSEVIEQSNSFLRSAIAEVIEDVIGEESKLDNVRAITLEHHINGYNLHRSECIVRAKEYGYEE